MLSVVTMAAGTLTALVGILTKRPAFFAWGTALVALALALEVAK